MMVLPLLLVMVLPKIMNDPETKKVYFLILIQFNNAKNILLTQKKDTRLFYK